MRTSFNNCNRLACYVTGFVKINFNVVGLRIAKLHYLVNFSCFTGPPNGPALFCCLASVDVYRRRLSSSVTVWAGRPPGASTVGSRHAGGRSRGRSGGRHCTAGQYGSVPLGRHLVLYSNKKPRGLLQVASECRRHTHNKNKFQSTQ